MNGIFMGMIQSAGIKLLPLFHAFYPCLILQPTAQAGMHEQGEWIYFVLILILLTATITRSVYKFIRLRMVERQNRINERDYYEKRSIEIGTLLDKMDYYKALSVEGKTRFKSRVIDFLLSKKFEGAEGLVVTEEMKVMISASAVQLTFGLDNFYISYFDHILIYPGTFYSRFVGAKLKGGTSNKGQIQLSWPDFKQGYAVPDDKINLGLHELAHALEIGVEKGNDFDKRFAGYLDYWQEKSDPEFSQLHEGKQSFLRTYGGTNPHEFFAVCVEHFFEAPREFKNRMPELYDHLCLLLNQDPTRNTSDYRPEYSMLTVDANDKIRISYRYSPWHWSLTVLLVGIFTGPFAIIYEAGKITDPSYSIAGLYFGTVILGFYPNYKYLVKNNILNIYQYLGYLFLGFGALATAFLLFVNSFGGFPVTRTEIHPIQGIYYTQGQKVKVIFKDDHYPAVEEIGLVDISQAENVKAGNYLELIFQKGILGAETFEENRIIVKKHPEE